MALLVVGIILLVAAMLVAMARYLHRGDSDSAAPFLFFVGLICLFNGINIVEADAKQREDCIAITQ